jgi:hypothetical protein
LSAALKICIKLTINISLLGLKVAVLLPEEVSALTIYDRRGNPIEIQRVRRSDASGETELYMRVKSAQKQVKQEAVNKKSTERSGSIWKR